MPSPTQPKPSPQQLRPGNGCLIVAIIAGILAGGLVCAGVCGGVGLYFYGTQVRHALEEAEVPLPQIVRIDPDRDWNDWMVQRELTHFYQTVLESATTDKALIEKLGRPIETDVDAEKLFSRQDKGQLNPEGEHIQFEVRGPKGIGKVVAVSTSSGPDGIQPNKIEVTLNDDSTVEVRPLRRPLPPVR